METLQPDQSPIINYDQPAQQPPPSNPGGRSLRVSKKVLITIAVIVCLLILGGIFFLSNNSSKPNSTAQTQDILLATVGDQKIYKSAVITAAGEQYAPNAITNDVLKKFYDILIERTILDQEAKRLHITFTDTDARQAVGSTSAATASVITTAKYTLIKNAITQKNVTSVEAYLIGYWIPPLNYQQIPLFAQQRQIGKQALEEGKSLLSQGEKPLTVAQTLYTKYPILQQILALNGLFVNKIKDPTVVEKPLTITKGHTDIDSAIFSLKKGTISIVDAPNGAGASLVQVVSVNSGDFKNYDEWLANKKKTEVKVISSL